jgi:hypothetical protein
LWLPKRETFPLPEINRHEYARHVLLPKIKFVMSSRLTQSWLTPLARLISGVTFTPQPTIEKGETPMKRNGWTVRPALLACLLAATAITPVMAQQNNAGLGSAWPTDAKDVSRLPGYHAYAWNRAGVKYVQINDNGGNVLAAFATANGVFLPLPMGRDAQNLQTPDTTSPATASTGVTVYQDETVQVTAAPQNSGAVLLSAVSTCTNPVECSTHINGN